MRAVVHSPQAAIAANAVAPLAAALAGNPTWGAPVAAKLGLPGASECCEVGEPGARYWCASQRSLKCTSLFLATGVKSVYPRAQSLIFFVLDLCLHGRNWRDT